MNYENNRKQPQLLFYNNWLLHAFAHYKFWDKNHLGNFSSSILPQILHENLIMPEFYRGVLILLKHPMSLTKNVKTLKTELRMRISQSPKFGTFSVP